MKNSPTSKAPVAIERLGVEFDDKKMDAIFAEIDQCHLPGAAVGIAIGGKPVYRKGFGLANMELPVVLSPTIRMRIGSTTKHFTALAYMLLCEDGAAGIDDPIGKYLPELHFINQKVTLRQLMGNIGGLRDSLDVCWTFSGPGRRLSTDQMVSLYQDIDDVNAAPGTAWIYNNGGWQMLTLAIERITGQSLEDVLLRRVFQPLGMLQSMLRRTDHEFVPNSATRHMTNFAGQFEKREEANLFTTDTAGEGGIVSTVDDMLRWLANMDKHVVGTAKTWEVMKEPQRLANGTSTGYGLGLVTGRYRGVETLFHPGGGTGTNAQMLKVPAADLDVVMMSNRHDVNAALLVYEILDACLPGLAPVKKAFSLPFPSGTFRSLTTGRVVQFSDALGSYYTKKGQPIVSVDGADLQVEPDDDGVLLSRGFEAFVRMGITLVGDPANPASIALNDFGNLDELVPVQRPKKVDVGAIAGRYHSKSTGTEVTIVDTDKGLQLESTGRFGSTVYPLECLGDGVWQVQSPIMAHRRGILSFDADRAGFRYSNFATRSLPFRRLG